VVQAGSGLSFGYRVRAMQQQEYRELTDLDLIEVSVVATPMQPLARVLAVEAGVAISPDIKDFTQGE
nr:HK97 family phage prohead protease [Sphingorhabdus sp.]